MKIKITKSYCLNTTRRTRSSSPYHNELWFYDKNGEFVFGAVEHKNSCFFVVSTDIRICGLEQNYGVYHKDGFMKINEMREAFYNALKEKDKREFFLAQHDYYE